MELLCGTSGYSYKGWKGVFYPEKIAAGDMLAYYAERLPSVEINNTFYRLPKASVLEGWAAQVPAEFRFVIKASRRITHFKRLKSPEDETRYLLDTCAVLGERLGAILFQLPPNMKVDLERLDAFLGFVGGEVPVVFEFRHPSWDTAEVRDCLAAHSASLCVTDTDPEESDAEDSADTALAPNEEPAFASTASFGYLRLRRKAYAAADLDAWAGRIGLQGKSWERAFVFFKHEEQGPALAQELLARASSRKPRVARPARRTRKAG